jgi:hypothetical protein
MEESEREAPRFEVTYTPKLGDHAIEFEGPFATLDDARDESARVYEVMDITDCEVEDHDEEWKPLNLQAKWLMAEEERQEKRVEAERIQTSTEDDLQAGMQKIEAICSNVRYDSRNSMASSLLRIEDVLAGLTKKGVITTDLYIGALSLSDVSEIPEIG